MSIRSRLFLAFGVVLGLISAVALYGVSQITEAGDLAVQLYDGPLQAVNYTRLADGKFKDVEAAVRRALASPERPSPERLALIASSTDDLLEDLNIVRLRARDPRVVAASETARGMILDWRQTSEGTLRARQG